MLYVLLLGLGKDKNTIVVDIQEFVERIMKHIVDYGLKQSRTISQSNAVFPSSPCWIRTRW